jgi:hypothetical protein
MSLPDQRGKPPGPAKSVEGERRSEPRFAADHPATLKLLNPLQTASRIPATVVESSRGGLKLRVDRDVLPGTLVQIRIDGQVLLGEVRFSNPYSGAYHVGVRLQDVFETNADGIKT